MFLILNNNGVNYTFSRVKGDIDVLAISEFGKVRASGKTRKEAARKARKELKKWQIGPLLSEKGFCTFF